MYFTSLSVGKKGGGALEGGGVLSPLPSLLFAKLDITVTLFFLFKISDKSRPPHFQFAFDAPCRYINCTYTEETENSNIKMNHM